MTAPWTFEEARQNCREASKRQEEAEAKLVDAAREGAGTEEAYRVALAQEIVRQHHAEGVAWSVAPDLARGDADVAALRRLRDIAVGFREAMTHAARRRAADRRDAQRFADWSQRRELAEGAGSLPEPEFSAPIGAR